MKRTVIICIILAIVITAFAGCARNGADKPDVSGDSSKQTSKNEESDTPDAPEESKKSAESKEPEITDEPEESKEPEKSDEPEESREPEISEEPKESEEPEMTEEPKESGEPEMPGELEPDKQDPQNNQSAQAPDPSEPVSSEEPPSASETTTPKDSSDASIVGSWYAGELNAKYNPQTKMYDNIDNLGFVYTFNEDGTYAQLVCFFGCAVITGRYNVKDGVITITDRTSIEALDETGTAWSEPEALPDASCYYVAGTDNSGKYLLLGLENATPPLEEGINATKVILKE
ncbi:MAG: hypothetical protein ACOYIF_03830 [Acetivibrionales bacterium]